VKQRGTLKVEIKVDTKVAHDLRKVDSKVD
jgi:hypothetical protein